MDDLLRGVPTNFRVHKQLGVGVSSAVFQARDTTTGRWVALKVMHPPVTEQLKESQQQRIEQEFRAAGRLHGVAGVIQVYNVGMTTTGGAWIAMELARGGTLADRLHHSGDWSVGDWVALLSQLLSVVQVIHDHDVVHGDINPSNLFFLSESLETLAVGDFGLCRIDNEPHAGGFTPAFAAPELFHGAVPSPTTDLYALGATMAMALDQSSEQIRGHSTLRQVVDRLTASALHQRVSVSEALEMLAETSQ